MAGAGLSAAAAAGQRGSLPEFTVSLPDGRTVAGSQLGGDGNWVLLYVRRGCPQCDVLLSAANNPATQLGGRIAVIVAGASTNDLRALAARYPNVPASAWFADPGMAAFAQLGTAGVPFITGMRGRNREWTLAGVLSEPATVESVLRSWVAKGS
jgi:hypothetical protein